VLIVVADTTPLNYLLLIDHIELLPNLFEAVYIPQIVRTELAASRAPQVVRDWIAAPPAWLIVEPTPMTTALAPHLDAGERAAIDLAAQLKADLILIDERPGAAAARAHGFRVTGTLGILSDAAALGLVDLREALSRLTATNFRVGSKLIEGLLAKYPKGQ
jgi:predicted nucleic acid-binding protein